LFALRGRYSVVSVSLMGLGCDVVLLDFGFGELGFWFVFLFVYFCWTMLRKALLALTLYLIS